MLPKQPQLGALRWPIANLRSWEEGEATLTLFLSLCSSWIFSDFQPIWLSSDLNRELSVTSIYCTLYGRLHVQGIKLATILAALDWMEADMPAPIITPNNWQLAELITEHWRASAHRLLDQLDRSGAGREERRHQDRVLEAVRAAGPSGISLRRMYRNLNLRSADARQMVQELVRDGQVVMTMLGSAEGCVASQFASRTP